MLNRLIDPYVTGPVGRAAESGIQIRLGGLRYRVQTWNRERRVVGKIEWHDGELVPRIGSITTNSTLLAGQAVKVQDAAEEMVDGGAEGIVGSKSVEERPFINVTTVLPAFARVRHRRRAFRGPRSSLSTPHGCENGRMERPRHNSGK